MAEYKTYQFTYHEVEQNAETGEYRIHEKNCQHKFQWVKFRIQGGNYQLRQQCSECTLRKGRSHSQQGVNMDIIPESKEDVSYEEKHEERTHLKERLNKYRADREKVLRMGVLAEYYRTDAWKEKRKLVMIRDKNICQACLTSKAMQAHHLTYKHLKNEPLFDLIAVCKPCHESITMMDRGHDFEGIKH